MNDLFKRTDPENNIAGFVKRTPTIRDALTWPEWFHPLEQLSIWFPDLRLYEWQRDAIRAACEPFSRVYLSTCNESGKTSVLLPLFGLAHMIAYPGCAVYSTSASEDQVKVQLFQNNLAHIMSRYPTWKLSTSAMTLESTPIDGLVSRWIGYKCIKGGKAEGYHGQWKRGKSKRWHYCPCIYMVDEGKSVEDELWESITRIDPDRLLAVSSPGEENGEFFRRLDPNTIDVAPTEQTTEDMSDAELESRIKMLEERERIVRAMRGDS